MSERKYSIYKITNSINDKVYIGWTSREVSERWYNHCGNSKWKTSGHLYNAIRKYGRENFRVDTIYQSLDREHSLRMETHFIKSHKAIDRQYGYNTTTGGRQPEHSDETRKKISEYHKGRIVTENQRAEISRTLKEYYSDPSNHPRTGVKLPREQIERQRQKLIGTSWGNHSQSAKDKISKANKGSKRSREHCLKQMMILRKGNPLYDHGIHRLIISLYEEGMRPAGIARAMSGFLRKDIPRTQIRSVIKSVHTERSFLT